MIKVEHTKTYFTKCSCGKLASEHHGWPNTMRLFCEMHNPAKMFDGLCVLVTDAELVLVNMMGQKTIIHYFNDYIKGDLVTRANTPLYWTNPILISRTEKIVNGDWCYDTYNKVIFQNNSSGTPGASFKILALSEHFSPKHLQDIVKDKLKEGKMVVECEMDETIPEPHNCKVIKLNSSNYITVYPVEEEMLTYQQWFEKYRDQLFGIPKELIDTNSKMNPVEEKIYTRDESINHIVKFVEDNLDPSTHGDIRNITEWFDKTYY